jgi:hypothetical protein
MLPLAVLLVSFTASAEAPPRAAQVHKRVVVLDIETQGKVDGELAQSLGLLLPTSVRKAEDPSTQVLSMADARALVGAQATRAKLGCTGDSDCLAELGGALGADEIITGRLARVGSTYLIELRRIEAHRIRPLGSALGKVRGPSDDLVVVVEQLVPQLYGKPAPATAAPAPASSASTAPAPSAPPPDAAARAQVPPAESRPLDAAPAAADPASSEPAGGLATSTTYDGPSLAVPVTLMVAGSFVAVAGIVVAVNAAQVHSDVDDQQGFDAPLTVTRADYQRAGVLYPVGWGIAALGVGAVGAGIWMAVNQPHPVPVTVAATPHGAMLAARGSF